MVITPITRVKASSRHVGLSEFARRIASEMTADVVDPV